MYPLLALIIAAFICYSYFWSILEWGIIGVVVYGLYRFVTALVASQDQQPRKPHSSFRPSAFQAESDDPLQTLTDEAPSAGAIIEEVDDALENEAALKVGKEGELRVDRILYRVAMDHLTDVYLEDERGLTQIDHIAKMPWGLVVIETKTYGGFISGTRDYQVWKQSFRLVGSNKYYLFQNPVCQNFRHLAAVRHVTGLKDHVFSLVVFAGSAHTSRRVHNQIVRINHLKTAMRQRPTTDYLLDWKRDAAWDALKRHAHANRGRAAEHLEQLKRRAQ